MLKEYDKLGFVVREIYNEHENEIIKDYAVDWLNSFFGEYIDKKLSERDIERYHLIQRKHGIPHRTILSAKNRHCNPSNKLKDIILNDNLKSVLNKFGINHIDLWDEGLGWLAFRLVRPSMGDGYPFSKKKWGPADPVLSIWMPVVGYDNNVTLAMIPGSHKKKYKKYKDGNGIFNKDEYRLLEQPNKNEIYRPTLKRGECIFFDYSLLHSEDVLCGDITRLSLEFRVGYKN